MPYNMLWLDRLVERMCRYLDDRYPGGYSWSYSKMKRGSYFFKRNWMEHYQLIIQGEARRPAFHFFVDNKAGQLTFECACRFERERAEQANLIIPHHVDVLFPAGAEVDISHIAIDFPNGFQVNNYDQQLDEAIWTGIVHQFLNQPVVHDFLSVNVH